MEGDGFMLLATADQQRVEPAFAPTIGAGTAGPAPDAVVVVVTAVIVMYNYNRSDDSEAST